MKVKKTNIKKYTFWALFFIASCANWAKAVDNQKIMIADSLFDLKNYSESFELYKSALEDDRYYSPSMLLKMAYVQEGLKHHEKALFYLSLCHLVWPNAELFKKTNQIATENNIPGYSINDLSFFRHLVLIYRYPITIGSLLMMLITLVVMRYRRARGFPIGLEPYVLFSAAIFGLLVANFGVQFPEAVVITNRSIIYEGPSAGASVMGRLTLGQKIKIIERQDVWFKIKTDDQIAYLHRDNAKIIELPKDNPIVNSN